MSMKKLALLSTLSVAALSTTSVLAQNANQNNNVASAPGFYVDGGLGYVARDWKGEAENARSPFTVNTVTSNKRGGFTGVLDAGYQFNNMFSAELGGIYLPRAKGTITSTSTVDHVSSYAAYVAAKAQMAVYQNTFLFGKLGLAYNHNKWDASGSDAKSNFVSPMFAAGAQYFVTSNVSLTGQYTYLPGYHNTTSSDYSATTGSSAFNVPAAQLFTVGVNYKFSA